MDEEMKVVDGHKWVQSVALAVTAIVTTLLAVYAVIQYKTFRLEHEVDKMERLYESFQVPEMIRARGIAAANYPDGSPELLEVFNFFEKTARSYQKGLLPMDDLDYYFRDAFLLYWYGWEDWTKAMRKADGEDPIHGATFSGFEKVLTDLAAKGIGRPPKTQIDRWLTMETRRAKAKVTSGPNSN